MKDFNVTFFASGVIRSFHSLGYVEADEKAANVLLRTLPGQTSHFDDRVLLLHVLRRCT